MKYRNSNTQSPVAVCTGPRSKGSNSGRMSFNRRRLSTHLSGGAVLCERVQGDLMHYWWDVLPLRRYLIFKKQKTDDCNSTLTMAWVGPELCGASVVTDVSGRLSLQSSRCHCLGQRVLQGQMYSKVKKTTTLYEMEFNSKGLFI